MVKLSDYVVQFLAARGVRDIFMVSGGAIMHLVDSVGRYGGIRYYCNYHEQACAVSAEGYARTKAEIGVCLVTAGPGATNALSGAVASWYDSVPLLIISGQVRRDLLADYTKLRQIGPQEANVIGMAAPVTKYACRVDDPHAIRYELERALDAATTGRPGPVWLEIPVDVQGSQIDETKLATYKRETQERPVPDLPSAVSSVLETIRRSRRPLFVCGNGIHAARAERLLDEVLHKTQIPIVLPHTGKDLIEEDHPCYLGVFGTTGQRRANFAIQNCDCLISLATGLNVHKVGFNVAGFAPRAKKVIVDVDGGQLSYQVVRPDLAVQADIGEFLQEFSRQLDSTPITAAPKWLNACAHWKERYPVIVEECYRDLHYVNSYAFMDTLSNCLAADDIVVTGNGLDTVSHYQAFRVKKAQRTITSGWGSMGWALPLSIGACIGRGGARTICVTGDGSIQWNIQELLTVKHYDLPVKIFIFNNKGYSTIRATQDSFFDGRYVGADHESGVANPDFCKLASAYGLQYEFIATNADTEAGIFRTLAGAGPVLCEVNISAEQGVAPKASAFRREDGTFESRPLEDMAPFLPREEIWENMHLFDEEGGDARQ